MKTNKLTGGPIMTPSRFLDWFRSIFRSCETNVVSHEEVLNDESWALLSLEFQLLSAREGATVVNPTFSLDDLSRIMNNQNFSRAIKDKIENNLNELLELEERRKNYFDFGGGDHGRYGNFPEYLSLLKAFLKQPEGLNAPWAPLPVFEWALEQLTEDEQIKALWHLDLLR